MLFLKRIFPKTIETCELFTNCRNYSFILQRIRTRNLRNILVSKNHCANLNLSLIGKIQQQQIRSKSTRKSSRSRNEEEESDDEGDNEEYKDERDSKVIKTGMNSLRADLILKTGLNLARNKVEVLFYESKIRVNGKKLPKKSVQLHIGDEVDAIKGFSSMNPSFLVVGRVIILSATKRDDGTMLVYLRRYKSLTIENYSGENAFKSSDS